MNEEKINDQYFLTITILLMLATFFIRGSLIAFSDKIKINQQIKKLFSFVPAAIFPAIIIPGTFFHQGDVSLLFYKERFFVLLMTAIFCFFVRHTFLVIVFGLFLLYLLKLFF